MTYWVRTGVAWVHPEAQVRVRKASADLGGFCVRPQSYQSRGFGGRMSLVVIKQYSLQWRLC